MLTTVQKVADGLPDAVETLGTRPYIRASTTNQKLYLITQQGVLQPSINDHHDTPLMGGKVTCFDLASKTWHRPVAYDKLCDDELLEGDVFGYENRLLLLTYQKRNQLLYKDLYEWKDDRWQKFSDFDVDPTTKIAHGECWEVTKYMNVARPNKAADVYLIAQNRLSILVAKLNVVGPKASVEQVVASENAYDSNPCSPCIVAACLHQGYLYAFYGQQGCGFHWEPHKLLKIDLITGASQDVRLKDTPAPPWSFSGPSDHYFFNDLATWVFMGGTKATGVASTEEEDSMWKFSLAGGEGRWVGEYMFKKPKGSAFFGVQYNEGPMVYLVNPSDGVYEFDPTAM